MSKTGWNRKLGTSKKEQGIVTPPPPRKKKCGCWFRGQELWERNIHCLPHHPIINQPKAAVEPTPQPYNGFSDTTKTEDHVAVTLT